LGKTSGVVVAAGTGSFASGINPAGEQKTIGGWGPLFGDEGSGFAIGRDALRAIIREHEFDGPATALTGLIKNHFQIIHLAELRKKIYQSASYQQTISGLTPLVARAASSGDEVALQILLEQAHQLAEMALRVTQSLAWDEQGCDICLTGGVAHLGSLILEPFQARCHAVDPDLRITPPRFPPVIGALMLALQKGGIDLTEPLILNLGRSYQSIIARLAEIES
jgi:N-acetylglucosamine kinase-like BadF-type ATPase